MNRAGPCPREGILKIRAHMAAPEYQVPEGTIRIDSNESVYGACESARAAARDAMSHAERYPEDASSRLAHAIAERFELEPSRICCGFGSDDLLARIARVFLHPGDELIYPVHGYQKIPNYAHANDAVPIAAPDREFTADVDAILECVTDRTRMVMLANPDNPTGTYVSGTQVRRLHASLPPEVVLVLDSAYAEYVRAADYELPDRLVEESTNVVMTRTFSKVFGLAGLRVGWLYGPESIAELVARIGITFPISTPSLAACLAALEDREHMSFVVGENARVRDAFVHQVSSLGLRALASETNFVLVRFPGGADDAAHAFDHLQRNGVVARRFFAPAFTDCIRFTVGNAQEMERTARLLGAWSR